MKLLEIKSIDNALVYVNIEEIVYIKDRYDRTTINLTNQEIITTFEKVDIIIERINLL